MIAGGILDVVEQPNGEFRFQYITQNGAEHIGPACYTTKRAAKAAGKKWLAEMMLKEKR